MKPGSIIVVDWRKGRPGTNEPNKMRPAVVIGGTLVYGENVPHALVAPMTGSAALGVPWASLRIEPSPENGCTKTTYALVWNVQCVSLDRARTTQGFLTAEQLRRLRECLETCLEDLDL